MSPSTPKQLYRIKAVFLIIKQKIFILLIFILLILSLFVIGCTQPNSSNSPTTSQPEEFDLNEYFSITITDVSDSSSGADAPKSSTSVFRNGELISVEKKSSYSPSMPNVKSWSCYSKLNIKNNVWETMSGEECIPQFMYLTTISGVKKFMNQEDSCNTKLEQCGKYDKRYKIARLN